MASRRTLLRTVVAGAAATLTLTALVACSSNDAAQATDAEAITVSDQWVKAADTGMTAAFGVLRNSSDREIRVTSAHTDDARSTEMHEVVDNGTGGTVMRQKDGGFVVPAKGSMTMVPGGEHLMLMGIPKPITTGQKVAFTLRFADGSTAEFDALARDFDGNQENYNPGEPEHSGSHQ